MVTKVYGTQGVDKVQDNVIATADLQDGAITAAKIASGVAGTGPAFSAYSSASQSITSATWTKVVCGTELFDTNSNYDTATARFTPTVEGYYQITSRIQTTTATRVFTQLYKNGVSFKHLLDIPSNITRSGGSALVYMNGSTDYIELYAYLTGAGLQVTTNQQGTYFEAAMIRSA